MRVFHIRETGSFSKLSPIDLKNNTQYLIFSFRVKHKRRPPETNAAEWLQLLELVSISMMLLFIYIFCIYDRGKSDIFYIFIKITIRTFEILIHFKIVISWDFLITFSFYYFQGFVYIFDSLMMQYIYINLHWVNYLASSNRLSKSIVTPIGYGHKGDRGVMSPSNQFMWKQSR